MTLYMASYGSQHRRIRQQMVARLPLLCHLCGTPILSAHDLHVDHVPPLASAASPDQWQGERRPAHSRCNTRSGGKVGAAMAQRKRRRGRRRAGYRSPWW